ncbi:MAG: ABC-F family ATP-binding cassette domain-containing protein [Pseudomonadota bacterium]
MLNIQDLELRQGGEILLEGASATLHAGWKVGVSGRNGSGKSTLFRLLLGETVPDAGQINLPPGTRIAHMAQEIEDVDVSAVDYVLAGHTEWQAVQDALAAAEARGDDEEMVRLHGELADLDGYTMRTRAEQLLTGLGFSPEAIERPVGHFSGGWRMRLNLARALIRPSDLLLLDEPTNHLDLETVLWLEQWLRDYPGTLLVVAHDRDFLDNVCSHILHFEHRTLTLYKGGYSAFERQRAEQLAQRQAMYQKQQQEIAHMERFIARFRAQANKARQAQSRLKSLERMESIAPAHVDSPFQFRFPASEKTSTPLLSLDRADLGYDGTPVLAGVDLTLLPGQRIGLLGPNGAGKSTLIRTIAGEQGPLTGERITGEHLAIGYFAQHQLEALDPEASPLLHLQRTERRCDDQYRRNFLGGFGFHGDDALSPVKRFSGGERARLALALIAWERPNLLLLDEPTNHLDLEMRHALDVALQDFEGTVILVTHDRHLLRDSVDEFLLVAQGRVRPFDGDLEAYRRWLRDTDDPWSRADGAEESGSPKAPAASGAGGATAGAADDNRPDRRERAARREANKPLRQAARKAEQQLARAEKERAGVEEALAEAELYTDPARRTELTELQRRQAALREEIASLEEEWLAASEALEGAGD